MTRATDRLLPQDLETERALLGALLLEPAVMAEVLELLPDGNWEFAREEHGKLWDILVDLHRNELPFDSRIIREAYARRGYENLADERRCNEFLLGFMGAVPSAARARHYAMIIHEKHMRRTIIDGCEKTTDHAFDDKRELQQILTEFRRNVEDIVERASLVAAQPIGDFVQGALDYMQRALGGGITTGHHALDDLMCGLGPSELVVVGGRPANGKTALLLDMACRITRSIAEGDRARHVLFFSLEMSGKQLAQRLILARSEVPRRAIQRQDLSDAQQFNLQSAIDELARINLLVDPTSYLTMGELTGRAMAIHRRTPLAVVFVDYLQKIRPDRRRQVRQEEVADVSQGLKTLAKMLDVPVVTGAQLGRVPREIKAKPPQMDNLRESGAIEQDADKILLIHRPDYYGVGVAELDNETKEFRGETQVPDPEWVEWRLVKHRNGPMGIVRMCWWKAAMIFSPGTINTEEPEEAATDERAGLWGEV